MTDQPHPDAIFDPNYRSRYAPQPLDGWRFEYRCAAGCPDAVGSMPATKDPRDLPKMCPDCGGSVELITQAMREKESK